MNSREIYKQIILIENELNNLLTKEKFKFRPDLWEPQNVEDMLKRFRDGESLGSIANDEVYDTSDATIKYILLSRHGGNMSQEEFNRLAKQNRYESRPDLWEPQNVEDMLKRFRGGKSLKSIAKIYSTKDETLKNILLTPSPRGGNMSQEEFDRLAQQHRYESRPDLWEPQNVEDMLKRFRGGQSLSSIAKIYHTYFNILKNILLTPSPKGGNMLPAEFNEIIARRTGSRIRRGPKRSRITSEDPNADPANTYSSRATGDDPVLSGPTRDFDSYMDERDKEMIKKQQEDYLRWWNDTQPTDPIAEAVELIIKKAKRPDLWKPQNVEDMLKRFRGGESIKSIANDEIYHTDDNTIKRILLDPSGGNMSEEEYNELVQQHMPDRPDLWEKEKIADMLKRFRGGESINSIANDEVYHAGDKTIKKILLSPSGGNMSEEEFKKLSQQNNKYESRFDLWEKEKIEDMLKRFRDGEPLLSITKHYEATYDTIRRILLSPSGGNMSEEEFKRLAKQHRTSEPRSDLRKPEKIEDILKAFRGGESLSSIARLDHANIGTIRNILLSKMSPEEYKEILSRRSMGSRIKRGPKGSRITPEDPNADPANTYSSRATGDDPVLSGPTRDPIAEAVEEVIKLHFST